MDQRTCKCFTYLNKSRASSVGIQTQQRETEALENVGTKTVDLKLIKKMLFERLRKESQNLVREKI